MACKRVIACMDIIDGRTVKGINFKDLTDMGDPSEQALRYQEQGADEIVFLDISATKENRSTALESVRRTAAMLSIPLTVGGGVRNLKDASALLEAGADKVSVNTAAVNNPELISEIAIRYGCQCCVVAIDCKKQKDDWTVLVKGGSEDAGLTVSNWTKTITEAGSGEILLTSWDRDGTGMGIDLELTRMVAESVSVPVIASGGIGYPKHFTEAFTIGKADAVLAAGILHRGTYSIEEIKNELLKNEIEVRPC